MIQRSDLAILLWIPILSVTFFHTLNRVRGLQNSAYRVFRSGLFRVHYESLFGCTCVLHGDSPSIGGYRAWS